MTSEGNDKIFSVSEAGFEELALEHFRYQFAQNKVYREYAEALGIGLSAVNRLVDIPFMPIQFFKSRQVISGSFEAEQVFESSGTTGSVNSRHYVKDTGLYRQSFTRGFERMFGPVSEFCILGLLPSYLERKQASLVYMVDDLIGKTGHPSSGFYLDEFDRLYQLLQQLEARQQKTLLIGVTFALLDFSEKYSLPLRSTRLMETGGMKGRREELIRPAVHEQLKQAFHLGEIQSEYGMTELLSQAYSTGNGIFETPPWMKILLRDDEDPFELRSTVGLAHPATGGINIIDLCNIHSCSFIATDDMGRLYPDGRFEVLGRIDHSDLRGCGLMVL